MTKLDYAKYLANLIQINIYSGDLRDLSACFYGLLMNFYHAEMACIKYLSH